MHGWAGCMTYVHGYTAAKHACMHTAAQHASYVQVVAAHLCMATLAPAAPEESHAAPPEHLLR